MSQTYSLSKFGNGTRWWYPADAHDRPAHAASWLARRLPGDGHDPGFAEPTAWLRRPSRRTIGCLTCCTSATAVNLTGQAAVGSRSWEESVPIFDGRTGRACPAM